MTRKQKGMLRRILIAAALFLALALAPLEEPVKVVLCLAPYLVIGWDVLLRAARNIRSGQVFDEHFLMSVATIGAFFCGESLEAVAVMLFYQVGELFQSVAVQRSRRSIAALMEIRPDFANVEREGQLVQVDPEEVSVGDTIVIQPGERVPLDGTILSGASALDTAALTGEPLPRDVSEGEEVVSGCVNLTGLLRVQVSRPFSSSTVSKILELVEHASEKKAKAEHFITKFARYYTPVVVWAAVALAVVPSLLGLGPWMMWIQRALNFLVVSCPCALVISIPLTFFGGIGGASRQGILVKGGNYLEALAHTSVVAFDKTGTLTQGRFVLQSCAPVGISRESLLQLAASAEQFSTHPIARSIVQAAGPQDLRPAQVQEEAGRGVSALVEGRQVLVGSLRLMDAYGIPAPPPPSVPGTLIHVARDGVYCGYLVIADQVKEGAAQAIQALKGAGVEQTVLLTGDSEPVAQEVGHALKLDQIHAQLLPVDKVTHIEQLLAQKKPGTQVVFVGDGINDAPVLSRADVGVAMGAMGSDAAIEAADVVLMDDDLSKLAAAIHISRKTLAIVHQNIVFALGVKGLVLLLSVFGYANLWLAVFADVGVSVLAILNAARMLARPRS